VKRRLLLEGKELYLRRKKDGIFEIRAKANLVRVSLHSGRLPMRGFSRGKGERRSDHGSDRQIGKHRISRGRQKKYAKAKNTGGENKKENHL